MTDNSYSLAGDIGGTNARFALVRQGSVALESVEILTCKDFDSIDLAIADYLSRCGVSSVQSACLAVASELVGDRVRITNNHWSFDRKTVRQQFGWRHLKVINDFAAMALGIAHVGKDQLVYVCGGPGNARRPRLAIGPGTGLGVSALVPLREGWTALETQGGHVDFAPTDDLEIEIFRILKSRFGRVSAERVLCGLGLVNLYQAHAEMQCAASPLDAPDKVMASALGHSCPVARKALLHFFEILGRVAGNSALTLGSTGGVYLCGGILPRCTDLLLESSFQQGFESKGRMRPLMELTPVYVVTEAYTGLLGAADALANPNI